MDCEPHFLDAFVKENTDSDWYKSLSDEPHPFYNPEGDCVQYIGANEEILGDWIDEYLTLYRSLDGERRIVGFKIKGIEGLAKEFLTNSRLEMEIQPDDGNGIKAIILLMIAQSKGEQNPKRIASYSIAAGFDVISNEIPELNHSRL